MLLCLKKYYNQIPQRVIIFILVCGLRIIMSTEYTWTKIIRYGLIHYPRRTVSDSNCTIVGEDLINVYDNYKDLGVSEEVLVLMKYVRNTGFLTSVVPAGFIVDTYGSKNVIALGLVMFSFTSFINPIYMISKFGIYPFLTAHFAQGVFKGMIYPGLMVAIAHWIPSTERATFVAIYTAGIAVGEILSYVLDVFEQANRFLWTFKYYISGITCLMFSSFWCTFFSNDPKSCPYVSSSERTFILERTKEVEGEVDPICSVYLWLHMLSSLPFLSFIFIFMAGNWTYVMERRLIEQSYTQEVLQMTSPLVRYCSQWFTGSFVASCIFWGVINDWMINYKLTSRTNNRKIFCFLGTMLPLPFIYLVILADCNILLVLSLLMCSAYAEGLMSGSLYSIPLDLCPRHVGLVQSLLFFISYFIRTVAFTSFRYLCDKKGDVACYMSFLNLTTVIAAVFSLVFLRLGSAEVQNWNWGPRSHRQQAQETAEVSQQ